MNEFVYQDPPSEELINGNVVLMSPRPNVNHNRVADNILDIFDAHLHGKNDVPFGDGYDLYLSENERYVPDFMVVCDRDKIHSDGVHGAPDLVAEVLSPSTARYDRGHKMRTYARHGVREYWLVSPTDRTVEQYLPENGVLELHDVYLLPDELTARKMSEKELAENQTSFRCSLYDDLTIDLEDVFRDLL